MAWHEKAASTAHKGIVYLAEKHPIVSTVLGAVGAYVIVKQLTASPTAPVPANPAPTS
jgi:hypothetical protein